MNWRGYALLLAILALVGYVIFATIGSNVQDYRWEKSVEARIEAASDGHIDVIDVRRENDTFIIIQHNLSVMTEKVQEATISAEHDAVEEAGQGTYVLMYVRPNRDRSRWYVFTQGICPTALFLEGNYSACEIQGPMWSQVRNKNTRWAN